MKRTVYLWLARIWFVENAMLAVYQYHQGKIWWAIADVGCTLVALEILISLEVERQ